MGKEYERYLRIARASANEVDYWLHVARQCELIDETASRHMLGLTDECLRMLSAMITRLRANRETMLREESAEYILEDHDL